MEVFVSWSGDRSHAVAKVLCDWIACVMQATKPWVSSRDIDRGAIWFNEIIAKLKTAKVGIVCLTDENKNRPWVLFEAGALAMMQPETTVCTFLVDLSPASIEAPLSQFNHTRPNRDEMLALAKTINSRLTEPLAEPTLQKTFNTYWLDFERDFQAAIAAQTAPAAQPARTQKDVLDELLLLTRDIARNLSSVSPADRLTDKQLVDDIEYWRHVQRLRRNLRVHLTPTEIAASMGLAALEERAAPRTPEDLEAGAPPA